MNRNNKLIFIGKSGYPIESIIGRPIINFIRKLILTRKIVKYKNWRKHGGCKISFD